MKNILIIEDNHTQQEIYKYWLADDSAWRGAIDARGRSPQGMTPRQASKPSALGVTQCIEPRHRTVLDFCDSISDAEKFLETTDYDFILLDLHLGDKESGFSFLEKLPKLPLFKAKVIVVSAYFDPLAEGLVLPITPRRKPVIKEKKNVVWLTKEEATQERLMEEIGLK